jgi:DNA modification methylase
MSRLVKNLLNLSTAIGRWSGLGPYYAMFPKEFAFEVVAKFSEPGDLVIDPFAGRASSIYAAAAMDRFGYGIEINPVGWLYGQVKLNPAQFSSVVQRIKDIEKIAQQNDQSKLEDLPEFFHFCYAPNVLSYLVTARRELQWKTRKVDATLMAIILVSLHGKREYSLSNQMRQGKAMSPEYSVRWWRERKLTPPDIDPAAFLIRRAEWRYAKGSPKLLNGLVYRGDSTLLISRLVNKVNRCELAPFKLLFTSPPYFGITNYHYDQWLRLWMLGGTEQPSWTGERWKGKFESKPGYRELLQTVFLGCSSMMRDDAIIYIRTDARTFTKETTIEVLQSIFPQKNMKILARPFKKETQTALYGDKSKKPGEVDIILQS